MLLAFTPLSFTFTLKSMPIRSKKLSLSSNEADFDRDLQILQAAQLLEQVGDLLVDRLSLADDEAEVGGERADFGLAAAVFGPRVGRNGGDNQVDK